VVFDTGPLICLDALGYLPALGRMYRVLIPDAVAEELERRPGAAGSGAPSLSFIHRRTPTPSDVSRVASGPPSLDQGEREAIAIALGIGAEATVAIDDRRGARRAARTGVPVVGTLAVLARIHRLGDTRKALTEDLDALEEAGMYLTPDLVRCVMDSFSTGEAREEGS
jgi:predicted nucleic acid-binding protein